MRKRRARRATSLAKRTALALLLAGPVFGHAATAPAGEKVPVLHVAEQSPELASVQKNPGEAEGGKPRPVSSRRAPAGNRLARLASANEGWVARDAIGKQVPLSDPASTPPETGSEVTSPVAEPEPLSLESLQPVPLMAPDREQDRSAEGERPDETEEVVERPPVRADPEPSDDALEPETTESGTQVALPVRRPTIESDETDKMQALPPSEPAPQPAPVISASVVRLKEPLEACLQYYYQRPENAAGRSSWGMMHAIMVYGVDTPVVSGRSRHNAIAWLAGNNVCRGKRLLSVDRYGIAPRQGVGLQGHQGQLLAVFGLVGVPPDYPLYVNRRKFTVEDLIAHEQRECRSGAELTFTLTALAHYIETDSQWRSKNGELWDFERLLQEELAQPVVGAACGGTHRLMGLSHALRIRKEEGRPISGQWARAETFIRDFTDYAWKLQNPDGSMSTDWFEGRGDNRDLDRKIQTTGHIVEWVLCHTPDDQLQEDRLVAAIRFLTAAMSQQPAREKEIGPKGHALRSLAVYHQRVFGAPSPWRADEKVSRPQATAQRRAPSNR